jgi:hypothetical protein
VICLWSADSPIHGYYAQRFDAAGAAQWGANDLVIGPAAKPQFAESALYPNQVTPDGTGGAIFAWVDNRSDTSQDIYAQRVDASGVPQWAADGVVVCTGKNAPLGEAGPAIVSDGSGGAIICWNDWRNGLSNSASNGFYAQRVSASGVPQWSNNGIAIASYGNTTPNVPTIASDAAGGAIISWIIANGFDTEVRAQRVNSAGVPQWTADGVELCTTGIWYLMVPETPSVVADGSGGAIVTWADGRGDVDIYAQRVDAAGAPQWTATGVAISTATNVQDLPAIASDGQGGAIIAWQDGRGGICYSEATCQMDIYAQTVNGDGSLGTKTTGVTSPPPAFRLWAPRPNPSLGTSEIQFSQPFARAVEIELFDLTGRRVWSWQSGGQLSAGSHRVVWNGRDGTGAPVRGGVYWLKLRAGPDESVKKLVLQR